MTHRTPGNFGPPRSSIHLDNCRSRYRMRRNSTLHDREARGESTRKATQQGRRKAYVNRRWKSDRWGSRSIQSSLNNNGTAADAP